MAQGVLSGIALGAVFSIGVAGVISVLVPIEPQPAPELGTAEMAATAPEPMIPPAAIVTQEPETPAAKPQVSLRAPVSEELPTEPPAAALAPQVSTTLDSAVENSAPSSAPVTIPQDEAPANAAVPAPLPRVEAATSEVTPVEPVGSPIPQTGEIADLTPPRPLPQGAQPRVRDDAPVLPNPQALAPMMPDGSPDVPVAEESAQAPAAPAVPDPVAEETIVAVEPAPEVQEVIVDEPAPQEQEDEGLAVTALAPKPRVLVVPGTQGTTIGADDRPRIGRPANSLINRNADAPEAPVDTVTQAPVDPANVPPVRRFAQPFENPEGKPLMGIVLMDTGADLDADGIGLPALSSFPYPVSFAVDAGLPDAAARMQRYRAEGFDVLAIVDLPPGARPTDAEVSLSVALNTMDEVVGVLEGTGEGLQGSRDVADQVTGILRASGHGLVTQSKGLDSMPKLAVKEGVPAAAVFRDFDSEGQEARVIRRFLDQAAFKAGQEGGVIMLGRLRPETIEALLVWGLADRAGAVALAPVSAVLLGQ